MKRRHRLIKDADFQAVISRKTTYKNNQFVLHILPQKLGLTRVGISVSKKLGNAVIRNKIRRQIRMMVTASIALNESFDYLIVVRANYLNHPYIENHQYLREALKILRRKLD